jgi:membrane protease YdiL (CAAX protease family)
MMEKEMPYFICLALLLVLLIAEASKNQIFSFLYYAALLIALTLMAVYLDLDQKTRHFMILFLPLIIIRIANLLMPVPTIQLKTILLYTILLIMIIMQIRFLNLNNLGHKFKDSSSYLALLLALVIILSFLQIDTPTLIFLALIAYIHELYFRGMLQNHLPLYPAANVIFVSLLLTVLGLQFKTITLLYLPAFLLISFVFQRTKNIFIATSLQFIFNALVVGLK